MQVLLGGYSPHADGIFRVDHAYAWPFRRDIIPAPLLAASAPGRVHISNLHLAFPAGQVSGTRLVLTQSTYQLQRWLDWEASHPGLVITADADAEALRHAVPDASARRGPWSRISFGEAGGARDLQKQPSPCRLHDAFMQPNPQHRVRACQDAVAADPRNPALLLALASASIELEDIERALDAGDLALSVAPEWEAAHFEMGKMWLRADDTPRAAAAFADAARLMPTFATAWSNLGAALGELARPEEAIEAFRLALEHDPNGHPTLNNLGVALRDLGRLDDAETAFRRVVAVAPGFVFGRYNLGQTLLLAGRHVEARGVYEEAFALDPQKSARQACRLAVVRAAAGDGDAAVAAMQDAIERMAGNVVTQALEEAESALAALSDSHASPGASPSNEGAVARVRRLVKATRDARSG